ncbi:hypothetical protein METBISCDRAFT_27629 [Metschnikowia bicuspidata]|uniref:Vacuolar segregation protein 7 n=1 Tax=Metschnikowia bicuspidata TaxID=27322 RepID=A0A4P9ZE52_9ASCO|nr:hypothetical protein METBISCDRAFT_27629 [Metschnikowia bicuspidata]
MTPGDPTGPRAPATSASASPKSAQFPSLKSPEPETGSPIKDPMQEDRCGRKHEKKPQSPPPPAPLPAAAVSLGSLYSGLPLATPAPQLNAGPSVINKQLLSKLNKSLKEKQKLVSTKESHVRSPTLIQEMMCAPPQASFSRLSSAADLLVPVNALHSESNDADRTADLDAGAAAGGLGKDDASVKTKGRLVAKQNSTRTDFFAAKLAIAVDDVESSDSDETFIYETNVNEYRTQEPTPLAQRDDPQRPPQVATADNASMRPPAGALSNENVSFSGSMRAPTSDSHTNSPTAELRRDYDGAPAGPAHGPMLKAESVHSLQSFRVSLRKAFNTTPPAGNTRTHAPAPDQQSFSNPYFDSQSKDAVTGRASAQSLLGADDKSHSPRYSLVQYGDGALLQYRLGKTLTAGTGLSEPSMDGHVLYDEEDDISADESSSHDMRLECTDANASTVLVAGLQRATDLASVSSCSKMKSSTTSSKLRSTTSKLFDKKGAQPRRYSIIPDDIDIEDFDDELIYYDSNIRFPYGHRHDITDESLPLVGALRILHYRSLNPGVGTRGSKLAKPQRYLSLGYVPSSVANGTKRYNMYPSPYLEHEPYMGFDEYDEVLDGSGRHTRVPSARLVSDGNFRLQQFSSLDSRKDGRLAFVRKAVYMVVAVAFIVMVGFALGFLLASTRDLTNVSIVSIENELVSQDELVFSVVVEALNPGWFSIFMRDLELDIFAKSGYLGGDATRATVETVLLGSVLNFESAILFEGNLFHRGRSQQTGEIKLVGPGKNITGSHFLAGFDTGVEPDNSEKWAVISKHPFDLILRGVLKYKLPLKSATKNVVVNKVEYVDPSVPG